MCTVDTRNKIKVTRSPKFFFLIFASLLIFLSYFNLYNIFIRVFIDSEKVLYL